MYDNLIEDYGQFAVMILVFVIGAIVYGGYLYYKRRQDMEKVNTNLKNLSILEKSSDVKNSPPQPPPLPNQTPDFVATDTFKGEQKGYVFKKGEKGLGYYKEN